LCNKTRAFGCSSGLVAVGRLNRLVQIGNQIADEVFRGPLVAGKLLDAAWADKCSAFLF